MYYTILSWIDRNGHFQTVLDRFSGSGVVEVNFAGSWNSFTIPDTIWRRSYPELPMTTAPRKKANYRPKNGALEIYFTNPSTRKKQTIPGGPDTPLNRAAAEAKARQIEMDIISGNFDYSLAKYKGARQLEREEKKQEISPAELWYLYLEDIKPQIKETTYLNYQNFGKLFEKLHSIPVKDFAAVKKRLTEITTIDRTKEAISKLSSACKWAVTRRLLPSNPYAGMSSTLPRYNYDANPAPNAFTPEEKDKVLEAFRNHQAPGISYSYYAPLVEFWFLTGCRPSEGIGLRWTHINAGFTEISFEGAITTVNSRTIEVKGSKNNKKRKFPISGRLRNLLLSVKPENPHPEMLIFPAMKGGAVNYSNFCARAWNAVVDPIKPDTTPYSCRDTFITIQILKGTPESVIAMWCDTSIKMIQKHYTDYIKLQQYQPKEY